MGIFNLFKKKRLEESSDELKQKALAALEEEIRKTEKDIENTRSKKQEVEEEQATVSKLATLSGEAAEEYEKITRRFDKILKRVAELNKEYDILDEMDENDPNCEEKRNYLNEEQLKLQQQVELLSEKKQNIRDQYGLDSED